MSSGDSQQLDFLRFKALSRAERFGLPTTPEYVERLDSELAIIDQCGFVPYFFICSDLCDFMRNNGIRFVVRGSGCGSVTVWYLGISHPWLDPVRYRLPFERFLNPSRVSNPDLDMDIRDDRRGEVFDYTVRKYGADRVARIITFGYLRPRAAVRAAFRVTGVPDYMDTATLVTHAIPATSASIDEALKDNELLQQYAAQYPDVFTAARRLQGKISHAGVHAAGVLISPTKMTDYLPLYYPSPDKRHDDHPSSQWDMYDSEARGLLKMDFLALGTLRVIDQVVDRINADRARNGFAPDFDIDRVDRWDPTTWRLLTHGQLSGVFQVEREFVRKFAKRMSLGSKLGPDTMEEWKLAILISIIRPGMMDTGATESYLLRASGEERVEPIIPKLGELGTLKDSYQLLTLQEDVMLVSRDLAGFSMADADSLRRAVGKKKVKDMASIKPKFIDGCVSTSGITMEEAEKVWSQMASFAHYGFNCLSGDTIIDRGGRNCHNPLTIEEMYLTMHDKQWAKDNGHRALNCKYQREGYGYGLSMCEDGRVRPNRIVSIWPSGDQEVYDVIVSDGRTIRCTMEHRFPTPDGDEKRLADLVVGDQLWSHVGYEPTQKSYAIIAVSARGGGYDGQGFPTGELNPSFRDGQWTNFHRVRERLVEECGACQMCGKSKSRYELHHINGDRNDCADSNLILLCASCHRREEYRCGRTRRYEKGYPTDTVEIVAIEPRGATQTYDIEMAAPYHNFSVDGLITCNSAHAAAYGLVVLYQTAYLKANYPLEYMMCLINSESGNTDRDQGYNYKVSEYVTEARNMGLQVLKPNVQTSGAFAEIAEDRPMSLRFGLSMVKGVASDSVEWLTENPECQQATNLVEFLKSTMEARATTVTKQRSRKGEKFTEEVEELKSYRRVKKNDLIALARAGALDALGEMNRSTILRVLEEPCVPMPQRSGEVKLVPLPRLVEEWHSKLVMEMSGRSPQISSDVYLEVLDQFRLDEYDIGGDPKANLERLLQLEHDVCGCYLSSDPFRPFIKDYVVNTTPAEMEADNFTGAEAQFFAVLGSIRETVVKKGQQQGAPMAFIHVLGQAGDMDIVIFPDNYASFKRQNPESGKVYWMRAVRDRNGKGYHLKDALRLSRAEA